MRSIALALSLTACTDATPTAPHHDYLAGTQPGSPWPVLGHDEGYTFRAPVRSSRSGAIAWKFATGAFVGTASPVIAADGTIYLGNGAGSFDAIRADGTLAWTHAMGGIEGAAAIAADGAIWIAADDARLRVLAADGSEIVSIQTLDSARSAIVLDDLGTAYFMMHGTACTATRAGEVSCGQFEAYYLNGHLTLEPAFAVANHRLYVSLYGGLLQTYDTSPPNPDAGTSVAQGLLGAIADDGTTYVVVNGRVEAHDGSGVFQWACDIPGWDSLPIAPRVDLAVVDANSAYLAVGSVVMKATSSGVAWSADVGAAVSTGLVTDSEGAVYFGAMDGKLYAFDGAGAPLFTVATGGPVRSTPAIGSDGTLYFGSDDGFLYAVSP